MEKDVTIYTLTVPDPWDLETDNSSIVLSFPSGVRILTFLTGIHTHEEERDDRYVETLSMKRGLGPQE